MKSMILAKYLFITFKLLPPGGMIKGFSSFFNNDLHSFDKNQENYKLAINYNRFNRILHRK